MALDILKDLLEVADLLQAIEASIAAHKGESGLDVGLDVVSDTLPKFVALIKSVEEQLSNKPVPDHAK